MNKELSPNVVADLENSGKSSIPFKTAKHRLQNRPLILLIDDDPDQRMLFSMLIEQGDLNVFSVHSAEHALEQLWQRKVDCVVCDVMMPQMNGRDFLKVLRTPSRIASVPVVMITAAGSEMELPLMSHGADLFCLKKDARKLLVPQIKLLLA